MGSRVKRVMGFAAASFSFLRP